jgi:hypothetical protein
VFDRVAHENRRSFLEAAKVSDKGFTTVLPFVFYRAMSQIINNLNTL